VYNGGLTIALGPLRVGLTVDGVAAVPQTLSGLRADAVGSVAFEGPACRPGGSVLARVDPRDGLDEPDEEDNTLELSCPSD
jgi:subtilase family serine protease